MIHIPKMSEILKKNKQYKEIGDIGFKKLNISVLRSYTCDLLEKTLFVEGYENQFDINIKFGDFNQYYQEILDASSWFYLEKTDIIILNVNIEDFYPNILKESYNLLCYDPIIKDIFEQFSNLIRTISENSNANIIVSSFIKPMLAPKFSYDNQSSFGIINIINTINFKLVNIFSEHTNIFFLDLNEIISNIGYFNSYDIKMMSISKNPYTLDFYTVFSNKVINLFNVIYKP